MNIEIPDLYGNGLRGLPLPVDFYLKCNIINEILLHLPMQKLEKIL
jgi:hypothetical protein